MSGFNRNSYANVVMNNIDASISAGNRRVDPNPNIGMNNNDSNPNFDSISVNSNNDPLFLQNNDLPGIILIAKKLTKTKNFDPWRRSMQVALNAKNKFVIVNGDFPKTYKWNTN